MSQVVVPRIELPVGIVREISPKTGSPYEMLEVDVLGFTLRKYLKPEEAELIRLKLESA